MGVQAGQLPAMEPPQPRLCHLTKWPHFQGYGFNLHTNKSEESQLVGNVDPESPADAAGVKKGDRIIEVNGTNISNENHAQVVARIKAGGEETRILVADRECFDWHRERNQTISSSLTYVLHLSPASDPAPAPAPSPTTAAPAPAPAPSPTAAAPAPAPPPAEHSSSESESETDEEIATPSPAGSPAMRAPPAGKEASSSESESEEQNARTRKESSSSEEEVKAKGFGT